MKCSECVYLKVVEEHKDNTLLPFANLRQDNTRITRYICTRLNHIKQLMPRTEDLEIEVHKTDECLLQGATN